MNPRDIMTDAIHNFHPQYQQYTQYSSAGGRNNKEDINSATKPARWLNSFCTFTKSSCGEDRPFLSLIYDLTALLNILINCYVYNDLY